MDEESRKMFQRHTGLKPKPKTSICAKNAHQYLLAAILCCGSLQVIAADWTSISKTKHAEMQVDMDSYNETDGLPYISTKTLFIHPQNFRKNALKFSYKESHSTSQFNCTEHTVKTSATQFFTQQKLVGSEKGDNAFKPMIAGSKEASLESLVCQVHKMVGGQ